MSSSPVVTLLPEALKIARKNAGMSQAALADLASISIGYIGMIELGQRHPVPQVIERLAAALDVPVSAIAFEEPVSATA